MNVGSLQINGRVYVDARDLADLIEDGQVEYPAKEGRMLNGLKVWLRMVKVGSQDKIRF